MYKGFSIFDLCAFVITIGLILSIVLRKIWKDTTNRIFLRCLIISGFAIIEDAAFSKILSLPLTEKSIIAATVFKDLYLVTLILIMTGIYIYMMSSMGLLHLIKSKRNNIYKTSLLILFSISFIFILLSIPNHWIFQITIENGYEVNCGYYLSFAFLILVLFLGMFTAFTNRKYLTRLKLLDCYILYPINIISLFHQIFIHDYSYVLFVITMTFYVISITTQRPETLINPTIKAKTAFSYYRDTESAFVTGTIKIHILVKIVNHSQIRKYIGNKSYIAFLQHVSAAITKMISKISVHTDFYYLEDSEFALVFDESGSKYVETIASKICELFYNEYNFGKFTLYPDVRTCIIQIPEQINNAEQFTHIAKSFHHVVPKEKTPVYYGKMIKDNEFNIKRDIERIIKNAIKEDRFVIHYQPIYNLVTKKYTSAEALIRIDDPEYGLINPRLFIPISEISGDIIRIGELILNKVLKFINSEEFKKSDLEHIEVNLTLAQCMESQFVEKIMSLMKQYNVKPEQLRLEITENMGGYNVDVIEENIKRLHENGINFSLDDYGTGYSNIKEVLALPVDTVKLDKAFVEELNDEQMNIVIKDTIEMLKNLGKKVLVEGIEQKEAMQFFEELNCEYLQGYLLSEPLPEQDFIQFINS